MDDSFSISFLRVGHSGRRAKVIGGVVKQGAWLVGGAVGVSRIRGVAGGRSSGYQGR